MKQVGVLALQGNFAAHKKMCAGLDANVVEVRKASDLKHINGLIIPGGESSALLKLMQPQNFLEAIRDFYNQGGALFGTCAGLILLATKVSPVQDSLNLLNVNVERNAYGRQIDSFVAEDKISLPNQNAFTMQLVFIRAPKIISVADNVEVCATCNGDAVLVKQDRILGGSFHPEMGHDNAIHKYFINEMVPHERT